MSDNLWQRELAQVNRDQQEEERRRLDERWDRLSRGELSPEEDAELRALAETSEEARAAYEAFRPLGPEFHASVVRAVREQGLAPEARPAPEQRPEKLLPFRRRSLAWWSAAASAAAAATVVLLLRPLAPLPDYSLEVTRDVSAWRGEQPEVPVLALGDGFTVTARPATEVSRGSRLEARCFLVRDRELRSLEVHQPEIYPNGLATIKASLGRDLPPGTWTLWAIVGRPGKLPDPDALRTLSPGARVRHRDWVAVPKNVRIQLREPTP
jgi:hypothetical protein